MTEDSPTTTTDALCRDCAHMCPDGDGGRWCYAPQIIKAHGRGTRCIFERDNFFETDRSHVNGTGKCGPHSLNFQRKGVV
jgi:hypothetical protein